MFKLFQRFWCKYQDFLIFASQKWYAQTKPNIIRPILSLSLSLSVSLCLCLSLSLSLCVLSLSVSVCLSLSCRYNQHYSYNLNILSGQICSFKLNLSSYIISFAKSASKTIGALIHSMKFLFPQTVLYLCKSTILPFMVYCCDAWAGARSCYLEV